MFFDTDFSATCCDRVKWFCRMPFEYTRFFTSHACISLTEVLLKMAALGSKSEAELLAVSVKIKHWIYMLFSKEYIK
jgi:hypothetical protein